MKRKKQKGITLIEVIIVMAIIGIIMAAVTIMFTSNSNILSKVDKKSELQLEAQQIQEQLSTVALECSGIDEETIENHLILKDSVDTNLMHHFEVEQGVLRYKVIRKTVSEITVISTKVLSKSVDSFYVKQSDDHKSINYIIILKKSRGKSEENLTVENKILFRNY